MFNPLSSIEFLQCIRDERNHFSQLCFFGTATGPTALSILGRYITFTMTKIKAIRKTWPLKSQIVAALSLHVNKLQITERRYK